MDLHYIQIFSCTSQRTQSASIRKTIRLLLYREIMVCSLIIITEQIFQCAEFVLLDLTLHVVVTVLLKTKYA